MSSPGESLSVRLKRIGISEAYAWQIANGDRQPSLHLALEIHEKLKERLGPLAGKADTEIEQLREASKVIPRRGPPMATDREPRGEAA